MVCHWAYEPHSRAGPMPRNNWSTKDKGPILWLFFFFLFFVLLFVFIFIFFWRERVRERDIQRYRREHELGWVGR